MKEKLNAKLIRKLLLEIVVNGSPTGDRLKTCSIYNDRHKEVGGVYSRRFKVCSPLSFEVMSNLSAKLREMFPRANFAIGEHLNAHYSNWKCTVIHCIGSEEDMKSTPDKPKEVRLTINEIAALAGCDPSLVRIVK